MTTTRIFTNSLIRKPHNKTQYNKEFKNFIKAMSILKEAKKQVRFAHVEKILMKSTLNNEDVKKLADETTNRLAKRYQKKLRQSQMLLVVDENVVISSLNQIDPGDDE